MHNHDTTAERMRGQTEIVGFVIVFSAILSATLIVSVFGLAALDDVRDSTVTNNGEVAMQALGSDLEAIYYGSAERRTTELTLDSASLDVGDPTRIEVSIESTDSPSTIAETRKWRLTPLVYRTELASIYYENSLIIRQQREGSVAVTDSLFRIDDDRALIPVVRTNATSNKTVSGGTHQIVAHENGTETVYKTEKTTGVPTYELELTFTISDISGREQVWARALNDAYSGSSRSSPCTPVVADDKVECFTAPSSSPLVLDTVVVSNTTVEYTLE